MLVILLFNITLLERSSVYINIATEVLTCFAVFAGKARLTVAMIFMMDIFITCCSVLTIVIFVTVEFCNTSLYLPLLDCLGFCMSV